MLIPVLIAVVYLSGVVMAYGAIKNGRIRKVSVQALPWNGFDQIVTITFSIFGSWCMVVLAFILGARGFTFRTPKS